MVLDKYIIHNCTNLNNNFYIFLNIMLFFQKKYVENNN